MLTMNYGKITALVFCAAVYLGSMSSTEASLRRRRREEMLLQSLTSLTIRVEKLENNLRREQDTTETVLAELKQLKETAKAANSENGTKTSDFRAPESVEISEKTEARRSELKADLDVIISGLTWEKEKNLRMTEAWTVCKKSLNDIRGNMLGNDNKIDVLNTTVTKLSEREDRVPDVLVDFGNHLHKLEGNITQLREKVDGGDKTLCRLKQDMAKLETTVTVSEVQAKPGKGVTPTAKPAFSTPPRDCWDLRSVHNRTDNGVYEVLVADGQYAEVYCDMRTDGGGWTVFQKRYNGAIRFNRNYAAYANGFGDLESEFWMGNRMLNQFTEQQHQTLRIDMCDWSNSSTYAVYNHFLLGPAHDCFRLKVAGYRGTAADALIEGDSSSSSHHNMCFSTHDSDNDSYISSCANEFSSGWWFSRCFSANLNGVYRRTDTSGSMRGLVWNQWGRWMSLKESEMKFRPWSASPLTHEPFRCPVH